MKTLTLRQVFFGLSIFTGIIGSLILIGGLLLFGSNTLQWWNIVWIGGFFTLFFIMSQMLVLSLWICPPLKRFIQRVSFSESPENSSLPRDRIQIQELDDLRQALQRNVEYSNELVDISHEVLVKGGRQVVKLRSQVDNVGKAFQELVRTLWMLEDVLGEVTKGNLLIRIPKELRETKIGKTFRVMTFEIRRSITEVRKETKSIARSSAEVSAMSQQGSRNAEMETQAVESISASIQQVAGDLREVMQNITLQVESLDNVFSAVEKMIASIQNINDGVELLSSSAEATARSIEEIHEFTKEIEAHAQSSAQISETVTNEAKDGVSSVGSVIAGIYIIKTTVEEAAETIQRLGTESERIGAILEVIDDIADQTNLLALNASIIAAQAGEHGRGFSVVADEIKGLAERTRTSTKEIAEIIRSVQSEVSEGMLAIQNCLQAVDEGVDLANQSGAVLKKISRGIQGLKKMVSTIARATVTQAENSQQVRNATEQVSQKLEDLYVTVKSQTQESTQIAEVTTFLKQMTQRIEQSAVTQLQETEAIVRAIEEIRGLIHRNANVAYQLAASSEKLGGLESNLAENIGQFLMTKHPLPHDFDLECPTIVFIYPGALFFFDSIYQGVQNNSSANHFQSFALNSRDDPILQVEHITWLMRQSWLKGIILSPIDEQTGTCVVRDVKKQKIPLVLVDRPTQNAGIAVLSHNQQGGAYAAELLREVLPEESIILVCGARNIHSIFDRIEGFFRKAAVYDWRSIEIFSSTLDIKQAKQSILEGLSSTSGIQGLFLTCESVTLAYIELIREEKIPKQKLYAVGYDMNTEIARAISEGYLLGTMFQDPVKLGGTATQELLTLIQQPTETPLSPKEVLVPVKKITKENGLSKFIT